MSTTFTTTTINTSRRTTMKTLFRTALTAFAMVGMLAVSAPQPAEAASDPVYTGTFSSLAVSGYDPVAYFTDGKPVEGSSSHELDYMGATWRFVSQDNLEAFQADPEKYAPQYGGYCAYAIAQGSLVSTDPEAWKIVDGKLYLNYSKGVQRTWEQDIPGYISKADGHWPTILN